MEGSNKGWIWGIVLVIVILGAWVLFKGNTAPANNTGPITIGFIGPLTGDAATYGEPYRNTVQLAVDEINTAGGISGRQVDVVYEDGKCTGPSAVSAAQKLINVDKVQAIIGGFCSGETIPSAPIAQEAKVLLVSPSASSPALTGISPYFFRDYPSDATQGKVLANVAKGQGWKTVAFIQEQTDYATGLYNAFDSNFKPLGGQTTNESFPTPTTDFRSILTKIKGQNPDALFIDVQTAAAGERIIKQMGELKWKPKLIISDTLAGEPTTLKNNAAALEGAIAAEFVPDASNAKLQHLLEAYKAKYSVTDVPYVGYMATVYDAVYLLKDGIAAVGYDGSKLATWSRTIKDWMGASGSITIGADGDRASGHKPEVIKNGVPTSLQ